MKRVADLHSERGSTAIIIVGVFTVLLLFLGMSVDFGILLRYRRAMQNACDSGALAGALNLRSAPLTAAAKAQEYAANDMTQNNIAWDTLVATTLDDNGLPTLIAPKRVRVEIHEDVPTYLFRLVVNTVQVAVDCTARLTPIILTQGLVPIGLNYSAWDTYMNTNGCLPYVQQNVLLADRPPPCNAFDITVDISAKDNPWGSGNTGLLSMSCFDCPSGGGAQWKEYFKYGAPTDYCYDAQQTPDVTTGVYPSGSPTLCANVKTEPGVKIGPISQGVDYRCSSTDPLDRIIMMPLLNPAYMSSGAGTYTTEIWGYAAFEIDCTNTSFTGADPTIRGGFVSIVSMQAYGQETTFDTGVYTIKLVK